MTSDISANVMREHLLTIEKLRDRVSRVLKCVINLHIDILPLLVEKMRLQDTCGIHNLHGMPALLSAGASAIVISIMKTDEYKSELGAIFPAMLSQPNGNNSHVETILGGYERTVSAQAGYQLLAIALTLVVAIAGGILTGLVLKYANFRKLNKEEHYQDSVYWEVPEIKDE